MIDLIPAREAQVRRKDGRAPSDMACGKASAAGSVSQRACVFCGSRVVLYPIADALHIVHGPIGCAAYTWDIRGALSSGPQLHRNSFSTDLQEMDVIFGGEKKLEAALLELIAHYQPQAAFVYSTCIVGLIGDDVERRLQAGSRRRPAFPCCRCIPKGSKAQKRTATAPRARPSCKLVGTGDTAGIGPHSINILGEFNLAGETWILRDYYKTHGHRGRRVHHRRFAHRGHPPLPRRQVEPGAMLRLDDRPGANDGARIRHPFQAGFLFRHRGHERGALRSREVLR